MATYIEDQIRDAINEAINTAFTCSKAWPNVGFTPTEGQEYIRASYIAGTVEDPYLDFDSTAIHRGRVQIDLYWPEGKGQIAPAQAFAGWLESFRRGTVVMGSGFVIKFVRSPLPLNVPQDAKGWHRMGVDLFYQVMA